MTERQLSPGVVLALASATLFGASTPLAKLLLGVIDPWMLAGLLYLGAGVGLAIIHIVGRLMDRVVVEAPLRRSDLPWLNRKPSGRSRLDEELTLKIRSSFVDSARTYGAR